MFILGISAYFHDAAAALVRDGEVVAALQEERLTRIKNDPNLPVGAIEWCLREGGVEPGQLDEVVFYEKPLTNFSRVLVNQAAAGRRGIRSFATELPNWLSRKLWVGLEVEQALAALGHERRGPMLYAGHHVSHAAAAFYPSPFERAAVLTFDGVGEYTTSSIGIGRGRIIEPLEEARYPDSIGLLYAAVTAHAGFRVNADEFKLMGLAPYGRPTFTKRLLEDVVDLRPDGSFRLNLDYFDFVSGRRMTSRRFDREFGGPPRQPGDPVTERDADLARSVQEVLEEIVLRVARHAHDITGERSVVLGGGVALNCVANGRLLRDGPFDQVWVQPAAGDAGSAIGAALWAWHTVHQEPRVVDGGDAMSGCRLGPSYRADLIADDLESAGRPFERVLDPEELARRVAALLAAGAIVGLFAGRLEFGPRALGGRSILADPRRADMQAVLNRKIKDRESFRPFAPVVLEEHASEWFDVDRPYPYMTSTSLVRSADRAPLDGVAPDGPWDPMAAIGAVRSEVPAVTHVDGSARVQTVTARTSPELHRILEAFFELTGCPVLVNTSLNVRDEPIVCSPEDAYRAFMNSGMDWLVLEDCLLGFADQPGSVTPDAPADPT